MNSSLIRRTALTHTARPVRQLIENRTVFESHEAELSVYDTYEQAQRVGLEAEEVLYCGMLTGRKVLHGSHYDGEFLPHESFVMAPGEKVTIDFPEAHPSHPTTCLTLGIGRHKLQEVCDFLNRHAPLPIKHCEWQPGLGYSEHVFHIYHTQSTQLLLERIVNSFLTHDDDRDLVLNLGITELLTRMLRQNGRQFLQRCAQQNPTDNSLHAAISYIDAHLGDNLEIDALCKQACMSRSKLYQAFKQALGCGPREYIQQRRLEKARALLQGGKSVTQVCFEVGYVSPSHFCRRFSQFYGHSPGALLKRPDAS